MVNTPKAINKAPNFAISNDKLSANLLSNIKFDEPIKVQPCHTLFEPNERPLDWPFKTAREANTHLFLCKVEATTRLMDGGRVVTYALPVAPNSGLAMDMRTLVFNQDGKLRWSHRMDRKAQGANFVSNFRESFILEMPKHLICTGTMWEGGVQVHCMNKTTGQAKWQGQLPFWSGIVPQVSDMSIVIADITALRKHYPYNGLERRFKRLEGSGGRLAIYATDGERLFFGANRTGRFNLNATDFKTLKQIWSIELGQEFDAMFTRVFPGANLLVLHSAQKLYVFDTTNGKLRYTLGIQEENPPMVYLEGVLYMLQRRATGPNRLLAFDANSGKLKWWRDTPQGTLRIGKQGDDLFIGAPGTISRVQRPEAK